jgi:hypothetical protein
MSITKTKSKQPSLPRVMVTQGHPNGWRSSPTVGRREENLPSGSHPHPPPELAEGTELQFPEGRTLR